MPSLTTYRYFLVYERIHLLISTCFRILMFSKEGILTSIVVILLQMRTFSSHCFQNYQTITLVLFRRGLRQDAGGTRTWIDKREVLSNFLDIGKLK